MKLFCSNYWQTRSVTDVVHYFHYNSHTSDFQHYCKMHLYCLKIYLTIPLCNVIPLLFQLNFIFFLTAYVSLVFQVFRFLRPVKGLRIRLYDPQTYFRCPLYTYVYIYSYLHRSGRSNIIFKIGVLKNFVDFTGGLRPATVLKRDSNAGTFLQNLRNYLIYLYLSIIYL